jgi:hypothetical protein
LVVSVWRLMKPYVNLCSVVASLLAYAWCHVSLSCASRVLYSPFTPILLGRGLHLFFRWQLDVAGTVRSATREYKRCGVACRGFEV